ncbi:hypothetical protein GEMRC1_007331 [Eukaryota sp. GEM-RC1]
MAEAIFKKRKTLHRLRAEALERQHLKKDSRLNKPTLKFKRAENFLKDSRLKESEGWRHKRVSRTKSKIPVPADAKIVFAFRVPPKGAIHPNSLRILQNLRLTDKFHGVFLQLSDATLKTLRSVEPHVIWGTISLEVIRSLILKKGFAQIEKERVPINDNRIVEEHLGSHGLICIEDIIHELSVCSSIFSTVSSFLAPLKLNAPTTESGEKKSSREGLWSHLLMN